MLLASFLFLITIAIIPDIQAMKTIRAVMTKPLGVFSTVSTGACVGASVFSGEAVFFGDGVVDGLDVGSTVLDSSGDLSVIVVLNFCSSTVLPAYLSVMVFGT